MIGTVAFATRPPARPLQSPPPLKSVSSPIATLTVTPDPLSFGTIEPGRAARGTITLHNPHPDRVTVVRVETSCPCIRVDSLPFTIDPLGKVEMVVAYDPTENSDFRGGLAVEVVGRGPDAAILFRTKAILEVLPLHSGSSSPDHGRVVARAVRDDVPSDHPMIGGD